MAVTVYTLDSFVKDGRGGNPAGVVLDADGLSDGRMLAIARQVGFSETAFVHKSARAACKMRFFTPTAEVDLCGHATVAAFALLRARGLIGDGALSMETAAGVLAIAARHGLIYMHQPLPAYGDTLDKAELAAALAISPHDSPAHLPAQIVSTGLRDILLPVATLDSLAALTPDREAIIRLSKKHDVVGIHAFCPAAGPAAARCRNFAPLYDIDEEAATGTSNGALACYLYKYGALKKAPQQDLVFEQGYSLGRPSEILARLATKNGAIYAVQVGGRAQLRGELTL
jgi:PhzF family phenazine biosynthesis protein